MAHRNSTPPPQRVCKAFGAAGAPIQLPGGRATSWQVGDLVLKRADLDVEQLAWQERVLGSLGESAFRVAPPLRAFDGSLLLDGWWAQRRLDGEHRARHWSEIISVGMRLHEALRGITRPAFLDRRSDPWAIGDRTARGELPIAAFPEVKHLDRLTGALRPIPAEPSQVIHGDLTGNVLFADGLAPAVIDFSPYWRPAVFATAIVVGDALLWEGAGEELAREHLGAPAFAQCLLRALIYRAVTDRLVRRAEQWRHDDDDPFAVAVEIACRLAARG